MKAMKANGSTWATRICAAALSLLTSGCAAFGATEYRGEYGSDRDLPYANSQRSDRIGLAREGLIFRVESRDDRLILTGSEPGTQKLALEQELPGDRVLKSGFRLREGRVEGLVLMGVEGKAATYRLWSVADRSVVCEFRWERFGDEILMSSDLDALAFVPSLWMLEVAGEANLQKIGLWTAESEGIHIMSLPQYANEYFRSAFLLRTAFVLVSDRAVRWYSLPAGEPMHVLSLSESPRGIALTDDSGEFFLYFRDSVVSYDTSTGAQTGINPTPLGQVHELSNSTLVMFKKDGHTNDTGWKAVHD